MKITYVYQTIIIQKYLAIVEFFFFTVYRACGAILDGNLIPFGVLKIHVL